MALTYPLSSSSANLAADTSFQARLKVRLYVAIQNVYSNNGSNIAPDSVLLYTRRKNFGIQILQAMAGGTPNWPIIFAEGVASDATVISDATGNSTTDVTSGNSGTQQLLVTDAHIDNAIAAQFNSYLQAT